MRLKAVKHNSDLFLCTFSLSQRPLTKPQTARAAGRWDRRLENIPKMRTDRKITRFAVLWAAADAVNVFAASEMGIEKRGHLRCDLVFVHMAAVIGRCGIFSENEPERIIGSDLPRAKLAHRDLASYHPFSYTFISGIAHSLRLRKKKRLKTVSSSAASIAPSHWFCDSLSSGIVGVPLGCPLPP